jgi:hypothetical protein
MISKKWKEHWKKTAVVFFILINSDFLETERNLPAFRKFYMLWKNSSYGFKKTKKNSSHVFHSNQFILPKKPRIVFNNTLIAYKLVARFFKSIYITQNLQKNVNIHLLCSNVSMVAYITKSLRVLSPYIYFSYYKSRLRYGIILCRRDKESEKVFGVQKREIQMISGANNFKSCFTFHFLSCSEDGCVRRWNM